MNGLNLEADLAQIVLVLFDRFGIAVVIAQDLRPLTQPCAQQSAAGFSSWLIKDQHSAEFDSCIGFNNP